MKIERLVALERKAAANADLAAQRLLSFFDETQCVFHVSFSQEKAAMAEPNSATSHIGSAVQDIFADRELTATKLDSAIQERVRRSRELYVERQDLAALPTGHLGPLPVFSTCFLVEFMAVDPASAANRAFAIACRRVLYLAYDYTSAEQTPADPLHPYSLFRIARALNGIRNIISDEPELAGAMAEDVLGRSVEAPDGKTIELPECLGYREEAPSFEPEVLESFGPPSVDRLLQRIERAALVSTSTEIAWHSTQRRDQADPTALLFAAATLSTLNPSRHDLLIREALRILFPLFTGGSLPARRPFYVDEKGRALFVASIECANILLRIAISRFGRMNGEDRDLVAEATSELEDYISEAFQEVTPLLLEHREGWCSDRAFSTMRIDSWVTVEAYGFFRARQQILCALKRCRILAEYSWIPGDECKVPLDKMIEPNLGDSHAPQLLKFVTTATESSSQAASFLLYGPPGTGKTTLAKGLAAQMGWTLITLSPSDFIFDSLDRIERHSRRIFDDLKNLDRCVVLFDEMDTLLRDREKLGESSAGMMIEFVVPALLPKLQEFRDHLVGREMAAFFVTNFYERLDPAIIRSGRLDHHLMILPYTKEGQIENAKSMIARRREKEIEITAALESEVLAFLSVGPFNLTYRDIEIVLDAFLATDSDRTTPQLDRDAIGISPTTYSPRRKRSYPELLSFMERYEGKPVITNPQKPPMREKTELVREFERLAVDHEPYHEFFRRWVKVMEREDDD